MVPTSGQQQSYPWSRASFIPSPRWQDPSGFTPLMMPQGVVWNPYTVSCVKDNTPHLILMIQTELFHFVRASLAQFLLQEPEMITTTTENCSKTSQAHLFRNEGSMHYQVKVSSQRDQDNLNANST